MKLDRLGLVLCLGLLLSAAAPVVLGTGAILASSTLNKGTITLAGGTGTAAVSAGAVCTCVDSTAVLPVQCVVAGTVLTATGTLTDAVAYLCL